MPFGDYSAGMFQNRNFLSQQRKALRDIRSLGRREATLVSLDQSGAADAGEVQFRATDPDTGMLRMVMSAINLLDELGVSAYLAGLAADGTTPTFWGDADTGAFTAGGGNVMLDQDGLSFLAQSGLSQVGAAKWMAGALGQLASIEGVYSTEDVLSILLGSATSGLKYLDQTIYIQAISNFATAVSKIILEANNGTNDYKLILSSADGLTINCPTTFTSTVSGAEAWTRIIKSADTSRSNTITPTADPDLQFAMAANKKYSIRIRLFTKNTPSGGIRINYVGPSSPNLIDMGHASILVGSTSYANIGVDIGYPASDLVHTSGSAFFMFDGVIHNGSSSGTFAINWAQNSSTSNPTTMLAGSYLEFKEL